MDRESPVFEANLLYKTSHRPDIDMLRADLCTAVEASGETVIRFEQIDEMFSLLTCERVQILLAFSTTALSVGHYLGAERPVAASIGDAEILTRLTECKTNVTVLVLDNEHGIPVVDAGLTSLNRTICWKITDCLYSKTQPDLVFWAEDDTLYAAEEFARAASCSAEQDCQTAPAAQSILLNPDLLAIPEHLLSNATRGKPVAVSAMIAKSSDLSEADADTEAEITEASLMSLASPNAMIAAVARLTRGLDNHRAINGIAMACSSTTIGLSLLPSLTKFLG